MIGLAGYIWSYAWLPPTWPVVAAVLFLASIAVGAAARAVRDGRETAHREPTDFDYATFEGDRHGR